MSKSVTFKLAGAAAMAASSQAYGQIVPLTLLPPNIVGSGSEYFNVLTGSTSPTGADFEFTSSPGFPLFFTGVEGISTGALPASYLSGFGHSYAYAFSKGDPIGNDTTTFQQAGTNPVYLSSTFYGYPYGKQVPDKDEYLGFQFTDANDGKIHNGWIELESDDGFGPAGQPGLFFLGGAYNSVAAGSDGVGDINAGAVPEPARSPRSCSARPLSSAWASCVGAGLSSRRINRQRAGFEIGLASSGIRWRVPERSLS